MISHSHKFILIFPPKTGSTSLVNTIRDCFPQIPQDKCIETNKHCTYKQHVYHDFSGRVSSIDYTCYGTIRNPFDRMVSWWKYTQRQNRPIYIECKTFKEFVSICTKRDAYFRPNMITEYFSLRGKVKVNEFIRFENLEEDFNKFCENFGIKNRKLLHINKTNLSNLSGEAYYRSYYDEKSKKIVEKWFKADLEYFGYSF